MPAVDSSNLASAPCCSCQRGTQAVRRRRSVVERGELTSRQAAIAIDLIYGSLWYRLIFQVAPLDSNWAEDITDALAPHANENA